MTIGENILKLRKQKGMSQEELAEKLNVSRQSISLWETNQTVPQIDYLMELSKIFNVSLDELCSNLVVEKEEESTPMIQPICETNFQFTNEKIKEIIITVQRFPRIVFLTSINLIFISLMILWEGMFNAVLFFDFIANIIVITYYLRCNDNTKKELNRLNPILNIWFYENNFKINSKSLNKESKYDVSYKDVTHVYITDNLLIIYFNKKYVAVDKASLGEFKDTIINKLKINSKKVINNSTVNSKRISLFSKLLFIFSFLSLIFGILLMGLLYETGKYSFCDMAYILYSWAFYIAAVIPLGSLIFGLIFNIRYKCKKNIIAGAIMTAFLGLYGSFCFIQKAILSFDTSYIYTLKEATEIDFPEECLLVQQTPSPTYITYIKFTNEDEINEFENNELTSVLWDDISNLDEQITSNIFAYISSVDDGFDKYCIYSLNKPIVNDTINYSYDTVVLCYNSNDNILHVYHVFDSNLYYNN